MGVEARVALADLDRLVAREADRVMAALRRALESDLVGVYLHGSAALGDWIPRRSDLDILAVSSRGLSEGEVQALVASLLETPSSPDAPALEFSLVTLDAVRAPVPVPRFELHLTSGVDAKVVDGRAHPGDPDLLLHFEVCRTRGLALFGPPPDEVFEPIPRRTILDALDRELDWALDDGSSEYQVLNAARAWRYLDEGVFCSKIAGGRWARLRMRDAGLVDAAMRRQMGADDFRLDAVAVRALVGSVRRRLAEAPGAKGGDR